MCRILKFNLGGDEGDRTPDLLTASQTLSQLSYAPFGNAAILNHLPPIVKKNLSNCTRRTKRVKLCYRVFEVRGYEKRAIKLAERFRIDA